MRFGPLASENTNEVWLYGESQTIEEVGQVIEEKAE